MVLFRWFCVRLMINVSNRWCCNRLAWASVAGVTRLLGRSGSGCGVVVRAVLCSGWRRPTDGYVIDSTWVISPLFITHGRVAPQRLMNRFTGVTNTRASSLGGEITVREKKKKEMSVLWSCSDWVRRVCLVVVYSRTARCGCHYKRDRKLFSYFFCSIRALSATEFPPLGIINLTRSNCTINVRIVQHGCCCVCLWCTDLRDRATQLKATVMTAWLGMSNGGCWYKRLREFLTWRWWWKRRKLVEK